VDDRRVISGIVHVLESGCRWIDAPALYGPRKTLYHRCVRWAAKGVWVDIFHALASAGGPPAEVLIDSSAVRTQHPAQGQPPLEELLFARSLPQPQRHRAHVRAPQVFPTNRHTIRPPRP